MKRQSGNGLRQDTDASIHGRGLHIRKFVDLGSGGRLAEHEWPAAEMVAVGRLAPRAEEFCEEVHRYHASQKIVDRKEILIVHRNDI